MYNKEKDLTSIYIITLLFLEISYRIITYGFTKLFSFESLVSILFILFVACFLSLIGKFFPPKANRIIFSIVIFIICVLFCINSVFINVYNVNFSLMYFAIAGQAISFKDSLIDKIIANTIPILILLLPFIFIILQGSKINFKRRTLSQFIKLGIITFSFLGSFYLTVLLTKNKLMSYELLFKVDNMALTHEKMGVIVSTNLDLKRIIFGFKEEIIVPEKPDDKPVIKDPIYTANNLNIDFDSIISKTNNEEIKNMSEYYKNDSGTFKNEYTGLYAGKNLIFIVAESFNEIALSNELTPTLYKMANESFVFENFYTPINLSTLGGEFQVLNSQFANETVLNSHWKKAKIATPYGLANVFENVNYQTYAFHNGEYYFQGRDDYLKIFGFDNYIGCGNGMEKLIDCTPWPRSDYDMVKATTNRYLTNNDNPFLTYYMTNAGHFPYETYGVMYKRYRSQLENLPYSGNVKAYLASQIDLDKAMEQLINDLTLANQLDDTVIVIVADHYPYDLNLDQINEISETKRDDKIEINRSSLIIWNSKTPTVKISKVASQLDVIPTVYNLFNIPYDSRLFSGKDILSSEPGLVFFGNRSWVSNQGTYLSTSNTFTLNEGKTVNENYVRDINNLVANRINLSKLIIKNDYYSLIGGK